MYRIRRICCDIFTLLADYPTDCRLVDVLTFWRRRIKARYSS